MFSEHGLWVFRKPITINGMGKQHGKRMLLAALLLIGCVSLGESFASEPGQVRLESNASGFDCGDGCDEPGANIFTPMSGGRVDAVKGGKYGSAEGGAGDKAASAVLAPKGEPMVGKRGEDGNGSSDKAKDDWSLYLTLPIWAIAYWYAFRPMLIPMKHN